MQWKKKLGSEKPFRNTSPVNFAVRPGPIGTVISRFSEPSIDAAGTDCA